MRNTNPSNKNRSGLSTMHRRGRLAVGGAMTSTRGGAAIGQTATQPSDAGLRFIGRFEGFRGTLYDDPAGNCTIGFGHLVHPGPTNGSEPPELCAGITRQRAVELLRADAHAA